MKKFREEKMWDRNILKKFHDRSGVGAPSPEIQPYGVIPVGKDHKKIRGISSDLSSWFGFSWLFL